MSFIAIKRTFALSCLLIAGAASAASPAPRVLRDPVFGLRYDTAKTRFDALPTHALVHCENLADNPQYESRWFVYGSAKDSSGRQYYVAGGYTIRRNVTQPHLRYEVEDLGVVFFTENASCTTIDSARQVFDDRLFNEELPQDILKRLSVDVVRRLERAFGGANQLRSELRNQRIDPDALPPELRAAIQPYLVR